MFNPLTLPPKLLLRALDDLNVIADAVRRLPEIELKVEERVRHLEGDLSAMRAGLEPLEGHLVALRTEVEPIQQMAAVRQAVAPLEEHLEALRDEVAPIRQLEDVRAATDELEPMIAEVVRAVRELVPKLEEIRSSIEPVGDVVDNLPKFMKS